MTFEQQAEAANARLAQLYTPLLEKWKGLRPDHPGLSVPMFMQATSAYFAARLRILFVGQETHGWLEECPHPESLTTSKIMACYQDAGMTRLRRTSTSHFWRAVRKMTGSLGLADFPDSVLTANIFICDSNKGQAPEPLLEIMRNWKVLPAELEILDPHIVIFFIGPFYLFNLESYFGLKLEPPISPQNLYATYRPPSARWKAWVTYHPNKLHSGHWNVLDDIAANIRTEISPAVEAPKPALP